MMDTSEQYVKMCGKAVEIQEGWEPFVGDFVNGDYPSIIKEWSTTSVRSSASLYPINTTRGKWAWYEKGEMTWLPRQDQLQEIVLSAYGINNPRWAIEALIDVLGDEIEKFNSHEQVWLGFVMRERHLKIWNGEEWI